MNLRSFSNGFGHKTYENFYLRNTGKPSNFSSGFRLKNGLQNYPLLRARSFSSSHSLKVVEGTNGAVKAGKTLPWLASNKARQAKRSEKVTTEKTSRSSWEQSAEKFLNGGTSVVGNQGSRIMENPRNDYTDKDKNLKEEEEGEGEVDVVADPRWDKIKHRFNRIDYVKPRSDRPEFRKWDKQESWGRKTWKEATESTVPKMVGEGIYGVGPVLAALSAGRREFYALYVQEGLDLSNNNRKKKDKKGFERVLRIAEKIGLSRKELSKHDLNMVVDSRPHQGLVLDASPLDMNLGAIIRSAYFFGASGVVLRAKNSAPLSVVVSKSSAGALELMELRSCKNMMQFLVSSAENGWRVLGGSVSSRAVPLNEIEPGVPKVLVLGSEGTGLRPLVERSCTQLIMIPGNIPVSVSTRYKDVDFAEMDRRCSGEEFQCFLAVESLNVSVAAGSWRLGFFKS
ncbi:hypothetical protein F0562_029849 [Nyssa sinensis]|uniref:rRNA methyltransferase 1, mitochondrial n=1 Tax=Nyssa sinensis TaxID=561372 RepID=A0A5J5AUW0_9ASTE|nr:hypothetical protein F0562_029849 [Nyssa sinensis]